jgi:hypothetical protein
LDPKFLEKRQSCLPWAMAHFRTNSFIRAGNSSQVAVRAEKGGGEVINVRSALTVRNEGKNSGLISGKAGRQAGCGTKKK